MINILQNNAEPVFGIKVILENFVPFLNARIPMTKLPVQNYILKYGYILFVVKNLIRDIISIK